MKLIIAGSRHIFIPVEELSEIIKEKIGDFSQISQVVSGMAAGMDRSGTYFAIFYGIPVKPFPANWSKFGGSAGPRRNLDMAEYADALLLIWDGKSKGSANMKARMKGMGKPIFEIIRK